MWNPGWREGVWGETEEGAEERGCLWGEVGELLGPGRGQARTCYCTELSSWENSGLGRQGSRAGVGAINRTSVCARVCGCVYVCLWHTCSPQARADADTHGRAPGFPSQQANLQTGLQACVSVDVTLCGWGRVCEVLPVSCGGHRAGSHAQGKIPDLRTLSCTGERGSYPPCPLIPPPHVERTRAGGPLPRSTLGHEVPLGKQFDLDFFRGLQLPRVCASPPSIPGAPGPPPSTPAIVHKLGSRSSSARRERLGEIGSLRAGAQSSTRQETPWEGRESPPLSAPLLRFLVPPVSSPPVAPLQSEA